MSQYKEVIGEQNYCDQSHLFMQEYSNSSPVHFEAEEEFINQWLATDTNSPLVIVGEAQSGKKTLLCSFLRSSREQRPSWMHICHFSSITPHYSHILYKIMIEIRNHYRIEQRVDLNDEKLRRYFKYWLQVASDHIEKEYLGYSKAEVPKVIIVVQGIDECIDSRGNPIDAEFWLPHEIPSNIKLILTTKQVKENEFKNATVLQHHLSHDKHSKIISQFSSKVAALQLSLYHLQVLDKMLKIKPNFELKSGGAGETTQAYIHSISGKSVSEEEVKSMLYILTLTRKGLRPKWVEKIVETNADKWGLFLRYFSFFIVEEGGYYIICNKSAKAIIRELVDPLGDKEKTYRESISKSLRYEALHLRELEEVVSQLYLSESYSELKEVISRVENFVMLYTPMSKDLLCECWVKLEQLEQYDPVFEYNKAVQGYKSHYYPKEEDLYKIIFQISIFFKEYAEFENARTPEFRHPLIKGESDMLLEIGIFEELKSLSMIGKSKIYKLKPLEKFPKEKGEDGSKSKKERVKENANVKEASAKERANTQSRVGKQQKQDHSSHSKKSSKMGLRQKCSKGEEDREEEMPSRPETSSSAEECGEKPSAGVNIQELNVSIEANQQKFRMFFTGSMKEYLENYFGPAKKGAVKEKELSFEAEDSEGEEEREGEREGRMDIEKLKESLLLKKFREYLEESYHKTGEEVSFYYYKQWIWLQFPWICQSVRNVYSRMIKACLPGSIHFMSPLEEFKLIKDVLKIARTAKENKITIFTEKNIEILPLKYSPQKLQQLESLKHTGAYDECSNLSKTKRPSETDTIQPVKPFSNNGNIDELIITEKNYARGVRERLHISKGIRGQASSPNFNMFVTETQQRSKPLPYLSKSKFAKEGRVREKENSSSRDITMVVRKYNQVKHENDMMLQKIEELKQQSWLQQSKSREELDHIASHLKSLEEKREVLGKNYSHQTLLQKKLELIVKVCDLNKMYGSESENLNTYLTHLKQMILLEDSRVRAKKLAISELIEAKRNEIRGLREKRKETKLVKEEREQWQASLEYRAMPLELIEEEELVQIQTVSHTRSKKEKAKSFHYLSSAEYLRLEQALELGPEDNAANQEKIELFAGKVQKKKQLQLANRQLEAEITTSQKDIEIVLEKLRSLKQINSNSKKMDVANTLIENKRILAQIRHRNSLLKQTISTLEQKC